MSHVWSISFFERSRREDLWRVLFKAPEASIRFPATEFEVRALCARPFLTQPIPKS